MQIRLYSSRITSYYNPNPAYVNNHIFVTVNIAGDFFDSARYAASNQLLSPFVFPLFSSVQKKRQKVQ